MRRVGDSLFSTKKSFTLPTYWEMLFRDGIVGWCGVAHFGKLDGGPGPVAGEGDVRVDNGEVVGIRNADDVFIVQVVGEHTGNGMEVSFWCSAPPRFPCACQASVKRVSSITWF